MKKGISLLFLCLCATLLSITLKAQIMPAAGTTIIQYKQNSVVFLSDSTTRSALLCNLLANQCGAHSPLIGTGNWDENGKNVQVSSLLYFDLTSLAGINQNDIVKAWLLMVPVSSKLDVFNPSFTKIRIRRVEEPWNDSITNWSNQPSISSQYAYNYSLNKPDTNNYYRFNVTRLVRQMKKSGNFGFEISFNDKENPNPFGRLYYSPREEDSQLRPMLIIQIANDVMGQKYFYQTDQYNLIDNFASYNKTMPMYERKQMIEYMKPPEVRPDPPPPPVKSDN